MHLKENEVHRNQNVIIRVLRNQILGEEIKDLEKMVGENQVEEKKEDEKDNYFIFKYDKWFSNDDVILKI